MLSSMTLQMTTSTDNMENDDGHHEHCTVPSSPAQTPLSKKKKSYLRTKPNTEDQQRRRNSKSAIQASLNSFLAEDKIWDRPSSWLRLDFDDESSVESFLTPTERTRKLRSSLTSRGGEGWRAMQLDIDGPSPASTLDATNSDSSTTHSRSKGKIKQRSNSCTSLPKTKRKETTPSGLTSMTPQSNTVNKRGLGLMDSWASLQMDDAPMTTLRPSSSLSSVPSSSLSLRAPRRVSSTGASLTPQSNTKRGLGRMDSWAVLQLDDAPLTNLRSSSSLSSVPSPSSSRRAPARASSLGALPKNTKKQMARLKTKALSAPKRPTGRRNSSASLAA
jgi:hypothetical protein